MRDRPVLREFPDVLSGLLSTTLILFRSASSLSSTALIFLPLVALLLGALSLSI